MRRTRPPRAAASGETARKRTAPATRTAAASAALTAQEALVAWLARDGLSNPEIGARLFISRPTGRSSLRPSWPQAA